MSFAGEVKQELSAHVGKSGHCQLAELAAFFSFCGEAIEEEEGNYIVKFETENLTVCKKCFILIKKVFHIVPDISVRGHHQFLLYIMDDKGAMALLEALQVFDGALLVADSLVRRPCCRKSFLRGTFLVCGSVTDPNSGYHLELAAGNRNRAIRIQEIIGVFDLEAKLVERKGNYIVYIKEGSAIVDFLNIVGAHVALMEFENVRIVREMRNSINRQVNCEAANIKKTVSAAARQVQDIRYIHDMTGFGNIPENLSRIARLRLENPEVTLKELGEMLEPPIGKSGVNHRLRKLSQIADDLRKKGLGTLNADAVSDGKDGGREDD